MAGRTGKGGAEALVYFKALENVYFALWPIFKWPHSTQPRGLWVGILVIWKRERKVLFKWEERGAEVRLDSHRARSASAGWVGSRAGAVLPVTAPLDLGSKHFLFADYFFVGHVRIMSLRATLVFFWTLFLLTGTVRGKRYIFKKKQKTSTFHYRGSVFSTRKEANY